MSFIRLNTAFILPEEVGKKAIELSRAISRLADAYFVLDGVDFYPHITIYPPEYPEKNIDKVLENIGRALEFSNSVRFQYERVETHQGYIGVEFERLSQIQKIHEDLVNALNPLREGYIREKDDDYQFEFSVKQLKNIQEYGYPDMMNLYNPHLTITRLRDQNKAEQILKTIEWDIPEFIVNKIGVYKTGEHGTDRELVKEFTLI